MTRRLDKLRGIAAPLPLADVDTDKIVPARFLKTVVRAALGTALFDDLRRDADGNERPDFVLNREPWREAVFLVALDNFGCGSSREHAPWALRDFGIRCVIAPSFGDIFANNCPRNGILPLVLTQATCKRLLQIVARPEQAVLSLDLAGRTLTRADGEEIGFQAAEAVSVRLIEGRDEIDDALAHLDDYADWDRSAAGPRPAITPGLAERLARVERTPAYPETS